MGWKGEHEEHGANTSGLSGCQREELALPRSWTAGGGCGTFVAAFLVTPSVLQCPALPAHTSVPAILNASHSAANEASQHPCEVGNEPPHLQMGRTGNPPSLRPVKPVLPVCDMGEVQDGTTTLWVCFNWPQRSSKIHIC